MADDEVKEIPFNPEGYHDMGEHAYKERTLDEYKSMVFKDSSDDWLTVKPERIAPKNPEEWIERHFHSIKHFTSSGEVVHRDRTIRYEWDWPETNIFGGFDGFFSQGVQVLDLGSGHGQTVKEINDRYGHKGIKAVGIDYRYRYDRPKVANNLVGGNFIGLPFKDNSFNRLLSIESFPAWLPKDKKVIQRYFREITRVSQDGTIWRGTFPTYDEYDNPSVSFEELIGYFCLSGWEVVDMRGYSFAAKLYKETKTKDS